MSSTSTVMTGVLSSPSLANMPPLMAPGSVGMPVFSSIGVVMTMV